MTELKTLKDIEIIGPDGVEDSNYVRELLKQEAIKWVKKFEKDLINEDLDIVAYNELCKNYIHFFNITESDLEEKNGI